MGWSLGQNWATVIAAAVVVLARGGDPPAPDGLPVVLICGVLPLGSAVAMFNLIFALMQVSTVTGEALGGASVALSANLGKVFTASLAIALGLGAGMALVRFVWRHQAEEIG